MTENVRLLLLAVERDPLDRALRSATMDAIREEMGATSKQAHQLIGPRVKAGVQRLFGSRPRSTRRAP